jgi:hypothetical protein
MAGILCAQIPNAGFETWASGNPTGWTSNNGLYTFVTQSTSSHGGSSAAQGGVVNVGAFNMSASLMSEDNAGNGFAISQRYAAVHGYYKFTPVGGDFFMVSYLASLGTSGVGAGSFIETQPQVVYKEFVANISYPGPDVPNNAVITFSINHAGGFPNIGSIFVVDDLSFGPATGVNDLPDGTPTVFRMEQNYPNPFNPATVVSYQLPVASRVRLSVFDALGREVAILVNQVQTSGRYRAEFDGSTLTSGVYFCRLSAGSFMQTQRMVLVK